MGAEVRLVKASERAVDPLQTSGMTREAAVVTEGMWAGYVRSAPRMASGWHHHADHDTSIYVVKGRLRLEFGPGGASAIEASPGDFVHVPARTVHRESNPADVEGELVVVRAGSGTTNVNVEGPE